MSRARRRFAAVAALVALAAAAPASAGARSWYVSADAPAGQPGDAGSRALDSLAVAERASAPGDRIVVLPAAGTLGGGIRLKPGQQLVGVRSAAAGLAPRVANIDPGRLKGDAVRLADGSVVKNLDIVAALRGAIYGTGVSSAWVGGNDVSDFNRSCAPGFLIPQFNVPTLITGVGIPISDGLTNGWAGIMVDGASGASRIAIRSNLVHDADCGDGIDVRASGTASVRSTIAGNQVSELRQGESLESVLAIGLQARERAQLDALVEGNRESGLGNDEDLGLGPTGADSEGVFVNAVGPSRTRATVAHNTYSHTSGRGGFSANGLEFVSMGDGSRADVVVRDSSFSGTPGDLIEELALGTNAHLAMRLHRVVASRSTGFAGTGLGDTVIIPGNDADCVIGASGGAGNTVELTVRDSTLTDCANNGLTLGSSVANGSGPTSELRLDVSDSEITGNHGANLRIGNLSALDRLSARVQGTDLSGSHGIGSSPANLVAEDLGSTGQAEIDLGGGALGSAGGNCLAGGLLGALLVRYDVSAHRNWWGAPGGPGLGRAIAVGGTLDAAEPLPAPPPGC